MVRRTRMSVDEGRALVARWKESGLSQAEFAKREQVDDKRLSFWARRVQKVEGEATKSPAKESFVRVQPRPTVRRQVGVIEVVVHDEVRVRVGGDFDEQVLRRVLAVLRELVC